MKEPEKDIQLPGSALETEPNLERETFISLLEVLRLLGIIFVEQQENPEFQIKNIAGRMEVIVNNQLVDLDIDSYQRLIQEIKRNNGVDENEEAEIYLELGMLSNTILMIILKAVGFITEETDHLQLSRLYELLQDQTKKNTILEICKAIQELRKKIFNNVINRFRISDVDVNKLLEEFKSTILNIGNGFITETHIDKITRIIFLEYISGIELTPTDPKGDPYTYTIMGGMMYLWDGNGNKVDIPFPPITGVRIGTLRGKPVLLRTKRKNTENGKKEIMLSSVCPFRAMPFIAEEE